MKQVKRAGILIVALVMCVTMLPAVSANAAANYYKNGKPTWTIMFYLCGADLEQSTSFGSKTLDELAKATASKNIRIVVQTGGSKSWRNKAIDPNKAMRFEIKNGKLKKVWSASKQNMGKKSTFLSFIKWAKKYYLSDHNILVMSDHGLGPVDGVICDMQYKKDTLLLPEMKQAMKEAKVHYDEVIFDTCITANLETAEAIRPYADYMLVSEEEESSRGNDYINTINYLAKHLDTSIPKLAKVQMKATQKMLASASGVTEQTASVDSNCYTQSLIKLSKVKALVKAFDAYAKKLTKLQKNKKDRAKLNAALDQVHCYEQTYVAEYRTAYLDLGDMVMKTKKLTPKETKEVQKALEKAVVYNRYGSFSKGSTGLFIYVPSSHTSKGDAKRYIERASVSKNYNTYIRLVKNLK